MLQQQKEMNIELQRNFNFDKQKFQEMVEKLEEQNKKMKEEIKEAMPPPGFYDSKFSH